MDAQTIQEELSIEQVYDLLSHLDGHPQFVEDGVLISRTICHGGDSHKLYYYENSKRFTCYTGGCGYGFSIFDLIMLVNSCDFIESLRFVQSFFGITSNNYSPEAKKERVDTSFFNSFSKKTLDITDVSYYNESILDNFYDLYHQSWIDDGISATSMREYGIKYSIVDNQIIIPHRDIDNNLIGVRVRNLNPDVVDSGRKYMPLIYNGEMYNHDTGNYLYGLNVSKNTIKRHRKIILFESEKSCMQVNTMFPEYNYTAALSGSNFSNNQLQQVLDLDVEEVTVALDKEFIEIGDKREVLYQREIRRKFIDKLLPYCKVSIIWDWWGLLDEKDSPSDKGKDVFTQLYNKRLMMEG